MSNPNEQMKQAIEKAISTWADTSLKQDKRISLLQEETERLTLRNESLELDDTLLQAANSQLAAYKMLVGELSSALGRLNGKGHCYCAESSGDCDYCAAYKALASAEKLEKPEEKTVSK
jgi:hypothetical protein